MSIVPNAPVGVTAETLQALLNVSPEDAQSALTLATTEVNRELTGAFRDVPQAVYDEMIRRVAGAVVGSRRRPGGGSGQLTRTDQPGAAAPQPAPRDYCHAIRQTLAVYVAPL